MAFKIMLDTNIILDLILQRSNDYLDLRKIYNGIIAGDFRCYTTSIIVQTSSYWLTKEKGPLQAKQILLALLNDIDVLEASHEVVVNALQSNINDIEDAMLYYTAVHHKIDTLISRDKNFIKSALPNLPVYHPADFVRKYVNQ